MPSDSSIVASDSFSFSWLPTLVAVGRHRVLWGLSGRFLRSTLSSAAQEANVHQHSTQQLTEVQLAGYAQPTEQPAQSRNQSPQSDQNVPNDALPHGTLAPVGPGRVGTAFSQDSQSKTRSSPTALRQHPTTAWMQCAFHPRPASNSLALANISFNPLMFLSLDGKRPSFPLSSNWGAMTTSFR